mmetsp:Transcript_69214/g.130467  ORF Transcript_69214/g.130467 Transcript_69214/m.130467 type:complete len:732 (+) Transcript_69214:124-2319(+)
MEDAVQDRDFERRAGFGGGASSDGSVWEEAIENTRRLLEDSKKQIELLRKQSHLTKAGRQPGSDVNGGRPSSARGPLLTPSQTPDRSAANGGYYEYEATAAPAQAPLSASSSRSGASGILGAGGREHEPLARQFSARNSQGSARQSSEKLREVPQSPAARRNSRSSGGPGQTPASPSTAATPRSPRVKKGAASASKPPNSARSSSANSRAASKRQVGNRPYMESTKASKIKSQEKVFLAMLEKNAGTGGGSQSTDALSHDGSLRGFKDRSGSAVIMSASGDRAVSERLLPGGTSEPGCSVASAAASGAGGGPGSVGGISACSAATGTNLFAGNYSFGTYPLPTGPAIAVGPPGRVWKVNPESSTPAGVTTACTPSLVSHEGIASAEKLSVGSNSMSPPYAPGVAEMGVVDEMVHEEESARQELNNLLDVLNSKGDGLVGVNAEEMVDKLERMMQDRRKNQQRAREAEAKLSQMKQENRDLAIENFKLRVQAQLKSQPPTAARTLGNSSDLGATGNEVLAGGSVRTLASRSATPVPVHIGEMPRSLGSGSASLAMTPGMVATVRHIGRPGAASVQQPPVSAFIRGRSESPGPRAAWAASIASGAMPPTAVVKAVPASPPISPRVSGVINRVVPVRHSTPTADREGTYGGLLMQIGTPLLAGTAMASPLLVQQAAHIASGASVTYSPASAELASARGAGLSAVVTPHTPAAQGASVVALAPANLTASAPLHIG